MPDLLSQNTTVFFFGQYFPLIDIIAFLWFAACVVGYHLFSEVYHKDTSDNIITIMNRYRIIWMRQMIKRDNRMTDAAIIGNLLRSITFLASTSILIVAGFISILRYREQAIAIIAGLPFAVKTSELLWEIKILVLVLIFSYAFFKYTWSMRTHNYTSIMVAAAPLPTENIATHEAYAQKCGALAINAAKHFNRGLRAYYFGLATLSWFLHPVLFMGACSWVVFVIYRREFRSNALATLLGKVEETETSV